MQTSYYYIIKELIAITIQKILLNRRLELELTQGTVAKAVGVNVSTISRWESGDISNMGLNRIHPLARVLQIDPHIIFKAVGFDDYIQTNSPETTLLLTTKETKVISAYRDNPDIQPAVDRLLKIEEPTLRMVPQEGPAKIVAFDGDNDTVIPKGTYQERKALLKKIEKDQK